VPQKIFKKIGTKTLIEHVLGRVLTATQNSDAFQVAAAVDHIETKKLIEAKLPGLKVVMTDPAIPSGTDRVFEAMRQLGGDFKAVVNVQGDMPYLPHDGLSQLLGYLQSATDADLKRAPMLTLSVDFSENPKDYASLGQVKVICDQSRRALYFSRHPIPFSRVTLKKGFANLEMRAEMHVGVYAYTPQALVQFCSHRATPLELAEGLEQLRAQWLGIPILVLKTSEAPGTSFRGIDLPADLAWAKRFGTRLKTKKRVQKKK
jgi:3-deoxy-manno-octulosonate cytidylyltransferase (CMP-KDO synthetase)